MFAKNTGRLEDEVGQAAHVHVAVAANAGRVVLGSLQVGIEGVLLEGGIGFKVLADRGVGLRVLVPLGFTRSQSQRGQVPLG